mmetsp:Transcript_11358/g.17496  ORF Transcript_11358/g.17496 Transcript_11358/m.17496 type:complete len:259 (-) Transcript_11358:265-1041(-)
MKTLWCSLILSSQVATSSGFSALTSSRDCLPQRRALQLNAETKCYEATRRKLIVGPISLFGFSYKHQRAVADVLSPSNVRVATWPSIEDLEPMYEFKLSIDALQEGVKDSKNWPLVKNRLDKFFKGAILSEKNFYFGVGLQYMNDINYAKEELPNYVVMDQQARYDALQRTMRNLENLKEALADEDAQGIADYAKDSQIALASWFALVPENDILAVEDLFVNVKKADLNRDGRISDDEMGSLTPVQQELWKKRVEKFG